MLLIPPPSKSFKTSLVCLLLEKKNNSLSLVSVRTTYTCGVLETIAAAAALWSREVI